MTTTEYENDILYWKNEPVLNLANHFHKFCEDSMQQKRVCKFVMKPNFVSDFTQIGTINTIDICMAIKAEENDTKFRFYPILKVTTEDTVLSYLPLEPQEQMEVVPLSAIVPDVFRDMILDNWNRLDATYIDDLFIAQDQDEDGNLISQMVRVHHFKISDEMVSFINDLNIKVPNDHGEEDNIKGITLYPGVDMNKFGNTQYISFTPVLGFEHLENAVQVFNQKGIIETNEKETLLEYMFPCPPTCRKKKK